MSKPSSAGRGRWRDAADARSTRPRGPTRAGKWIRAALVSSIAIAMIGVVGFLVRIFILGSATRTVFIPFRVSSYRKPQITPIRGAAAERQAMAAASLRFREDPLDADGDLTLENFKTKLNGLRAEKREAPVVAYVSGYSMVDGSGAVQILASDSDPFTPRTQLPLRQVLEALRACPAKDRLLVLDIIKLSSYPFDLGGTPDGVADLVRREVETDEDGKPRGDDPGLLVLVACSPGESGLWSEHLGESIFAHVFARAFTDPKADRDGLGTLSVQELADYLHANVDGFARRLRGTSQRPYLIGNGDFSIAGIVRPTESPRGAVAALEKSAGTAADSLKTSAEKKAEDAKASAGKKAEGLKAAGADPAKPPRPDGPGEASPTEKGGADEPAPADASRYPDWLIAGWELRRNWWNDPATSRFPGAASPRAFRKLEGVLLRSESAWRSGESPTVVRDEFREAMAPLVAAMDHDRALPAPTSIRSVGQAVAGGWKPDGALVLRLRDLLDDLKARTGHPPNEAVLAARKKAVGELAQAIKGKPTPSLELAGILIEATADVRVAPDTLGLLDDLVKQTATKLNIVELRLFEDLAASAAPPAPWPDEAADTARVAWDALCLAERAAHQPSAFPWTADLLARADRARHEARVLLLKEVRGFVSWKQTGEAWAAAVESLRKASEAQKLIEDARTELDRSRAIISGYLPFLQASSRPGLETVWQEAARASGELARILGTPPDTESDSSSDPGHSAIDMQLNELGPALGSLRASNEALLRPFREESLREAIAQTKADKPDPRAAAEIDALLASPMPAPEWRPRLVDAVRSLDARLAESTARLERLPDDSGPSARLEQARTQAVRRARRLQTLLSLMGEAALARNLCPGVELTSEIESMSRGSATAAAGPEDGIARLWGSLARVASSASCKLNALLERSDRGDDPAGWIAPPFLLDTTVNPRFAMGVEVARRHGRWLAARYLHEERDLHEGGDPERFYEDAAEECPGHPDPTATSLRLAVDGAEATTLSSSRSSTRAEVKLSLVGSGRGTPAKARIAVHSPGDDRLKIGVPESGPVELTGLAPTVVGINLTWVDQGGAAAKEPPPGFLIGATLSDGRSFHQRVPIRIESDQILPSFVLGTGDGPPAGIPTDPLRLRTLPGRQSFQVLIRNPFPRSREVSVQLLSGETVLATSGDKPVAVPANGTVAVKALAPGSPSLAPTKDKEPLLEAPAGLKLRMIESTAGGAKGFTIVQPLRPEIIDPSEYVDVRLAQFTPAIQGRPNELKLVLRTMPGMTGPPCQAELVLPADRSLFPSLLSPQTEGKHAGPLPAGGDLTLSAEGLRLDPGEPPNGSFYLNLDGVKRALWYRAQFSEVAGIQRAEPESKSPRIRFRIDRTVRAGGPTLLQVHFEVDKAPPRSRLTFEIGRDEGNGFVADVRAAPRPPKQQHVGFALGEGGTLLLEAAIDDWTDPYPLNIRGRRQAIARLVDPAGMELRSYAEDIVLDDQPPAIPTIKVAPEVDEGGRPFEARIVVTPPISGVREVAYIVGPKLLDDEEFAKARAENKTSDARRAGNDDREWAAPIVIPKDATGRIFITARAISGVGLAGKGGEVVKLRPRPMAADDAAAKKKDEPPALATVEGTVNEASVAQPNLRVALLDPNPKDPAKMVIKETVTDDNGKFQLKDVAPGEYMLFSINDNSKRFYYKPLHVDPGAAVSLKLELLR
ncbi:carboxypeptidase-like regulatory domain-containing protein [Aquisphaera insulae]|uniref:carboxypeptidase-like regulatory domain-containing protein n=1 Tax=Aquisphaera insulae TaxID=2712864 RepID=UPI0013EBDF5D|nr:carboxypeptidase-like regulatory domain-containing protein [Aquisphaera insulae]